MPKSPLQANPSQTSKASCYSLKYQDGTNTPLYCIPSISPLTKQRQRKDHQKQSSSFETCESENSPQKNTIRRGRTNKIKVELCKNFVEKGFCPYENRCRFAHGIGQLRAKDTCGNSELYRTRKCKVFYEKHECKFGERCNFMHANLKFEQIVVRNGRAIKEAIRMNFAQISFESYTSRVQSSKLLGLLATQQS